MKVDVPGRGAVDISRVAIVGPVWTNLEPADAERNEEASGQ